MLKETVNENFPNGLSPLDLARQFELHNIAALIEGAGGCSGMWADVPRVVFLSYCGELFTISSSLKKVCDPSQGGHEAVKMAVLKLLGVQTVVHAADDSQLVKEQVLDQRPDLRDVVTHVLPHIQVRHWKRVGLALGTKKSTLNGLGEKFPDDEDRYLETLSYWLEHGTSVTWKTLLDVLGHFETKHTIDELTDKIVSELGGAHQVSVQCCVLSEGAVWCAVWSRQVLLSCHVCLCLCCLLFSSFPLLLPCNPPLSNLPPPPLCLFCFPFLPSPPSSVSLLFPLCSQVSPQLASSSRSLVHIKRTADLSWPLAKRRRTSDEEGTRSVFSW